VGAVDFTAEAVDFTAEAVGLLEDFTAEAVAGMAEAVATMVPWPTWVMGGVVMHRARTAGLTGVRAAAVITTLPVISVTTTQRPVMLRGLPVTI